MRRRSKIGHIMHVSESVVRVRRRHEDGEPRLRKRDFE